MLLPFGKLELDGGGSDIAWLKRTRAQELSAWRARLERAGCEVERDGEGQLNVLLPGPEAAFLPPPAPGPAGPEGDLGAVADRVQRWFWDRMIVTVSETGAARFRLVYFSQSQILLHLVMTALFAFEAWFGNGVIPQEPARFALLLAAVQAVPALVAIGGFRVALASALTRAKQ